LRYEVLTGLRYEQLHQLSLQILGRAGDVVRPGGRPAAIGLFRSVAMVVTLMRKNITQEVAGAVFGVGCGSFRGTRYQTFGHIGSVWDKQGLMCAGTWRWLRSQRCRGPARLLAW